MVSTRINWNFQDSHGNYYVRSNDTMEIVALAGDKEVVDKMRQIDGPDRRIVGYRSNEYAVFNDGSTTFGVDGVTEFSMSYYKIAVTTDSSTWIIKCNSGIHKRLPQRLTGIKMFGLGIIVNGYTGDGYYNSWWLYDDGEWGLQKCHKPDPESSPNVSRSSISEDGLYYLGMLRYDFDEPVHRHIYFSDPDIGVLFVRQRDNQPVFRSMYRLGWNEDWDNGEIIDINDDYVLVLNKSGEYDIYQFDGWLNLVASNVYYEPNVVHKSAVSC